MSSFDADGYCRPPGSYDVNNRRGRLHRDRHPGLWWRLRADGSVAWEYKTKVQDEDVTIPLDARNEREAIREWKIQRGKVAANEAVPRGNHRLDDAWALYAKEMDAWVAEGTLSKKTRASYESRYRHHIQPELGQAYLRNITRDDVIDLFRDLRDEGLANWTRCSIKNALKHALDKAVAERWIPVSPLSLVDPKYLPKQEAREDYEPRLLRPDELDKLIDACSPLYREQVIVMAFTGLRIGEACGALWGDVNLAERVLHCQNQVDFDEETETWGVDRTKGKRTARRTLSRRKVSLTPRAVEALKTQRQVEWAKGFGRDDDFVFTTGEGSGLPVIPSNLRKRGVGAAGLKAGIGHVRPHDLRHTCASSLAAAGELDHVAAQHMGHTTDTFHNTYAKAFRDEEERTGTLARLDRLGFGS